jgi:hypothetical protein
MHHYRAIAKKAAKMTDEKLSSELSGLCRLTDKEINKLFPAKEDKKKLLKVLEIVNAESSKNQKIAKLKDNIEDVAGVILKLAKTLI